MPKRGKNYKEAVQAYDKAELYDVDPAMEIVTKTAKAKFDETVEVHVRLGVDGTLISRFVVLSFCRMVLVKLRRFWYLQRDLRLLKQKKPVLIL